MASTLHSQSLALEDRSLAHLLYGLMACFPLFLVPAGLSLLINIYQPQQDPNSTMAVHLRWQRWSIMGLFTVFLVGYLASQQWLSTTLYVAGAVWFSGRVLKGWLSLIEGRNL